jgi:hypothetical protein
LLVGKTIQKSFDIGKAAVEAAPEAGRWGDAAHEKFKLMPVDADHEVAIFEDAPEGDYIDETPPLPYSTCETPLKYFLGRNVKQQELFSTIALGSRCVTIRGPAGIGKTALANQTCHYINERRLFPDGSTTAYNTRGFV